MGSGLSRVERSSQYSSTCTATKPPGRREEIEHVEHMGEQLEDTTEEKEADKVAMLGIVKGKLLITTLITLCAYAHQLVALVSLV